MLLAHGSGIDDTAFVVLPLLVLAAMRWFHRRPGHQPGEARENRRASGNDAANS
jgi:hypothetical protein